MALKDETGNRYGKLVVISRDYSKPNSKKKAYWLCQCDCGNQTIVHGVKLRNGETKSCGCLRKEKAKENVDNIIGLKFGKLTVIQRDGSTPQGVATWLCQCECGKYSVVLGSNLRNGHTTSCGCVQKEHLRQAHLTDIAGQHFGKLTALYRTNKKSGTNSIWHCACSCGKECDVDINSLTQGKTSSCGCLSTSKGEFIIEQILQQNNIYFEREKTFEDCRSPKTNYPYRFDFFINNKYLIEFDGEQHFLTEARKGSFITNERIEEIQFNDNYKNNWCLAKKIPLIRIPYTKLKTLTLSDLLLETSNFIYKEGDKNKDD